MTISKQKPTREQPMQAPLDEPSLPLVMDKLQKLFGALIGLRQKIKEINDSLRGTAPEAVREDYPRPEGQLYALIATVDGMDVVAEEAKDQVRILCRLMGVESNG